MCADFYGVFDHDSIDHQDGIGVKLPHFHWLHDHFLSVCVQHCNLSDRVQLHPRARLVLLHELLPRQEHFLLIHDLTLLWKRCHSQRLWHNCRRYLRPYVYDVSHIPLHIQGWRTRTRLAAHWLDEQKKRTKNARCRSPIFRQQPSLICKQAQVI